MTATRSSFDTVELVRFLFIRLDEEDERLRKLARQSDSSIPGGAGPSPDQLRRDVGAKRQMLGYVQQLLVLRDLPSEKKVRDLATQMLQSLAVPYSDHALFRAEWRVAPTVRAPRRAATIA